MPAVNKESPHPTGGCGLAGKREFLRDLRQPVVVAVLVDDVTGRVRMAGLADRGPVTVLLQLQCVGLGFLRACESLVPLVVPGVAGEANLIVALHRGLVVIVVLVVMVVVMLVVVPVETMIAMATAKQSVDRQEHREGHIHCKTQ